MTDEEVLYKLVLGTIGDTPENWPGGWPGEIEAALIDAVFSIRARYGNRSRRTGVYGAVVRWRDHREPPTDDLSVLAATPEPQLRDITNSGGLAGRTKAQVVLDAAKALVEAGPAWSATFRLGQARVFVPEEWLKATGTRPGQQATLDMDTRSSLS